MTQDETVDIEGVRVTHPDRVLWPAQGVTKRSLIEHYLAVADHMLPHVTGRPLSLVRCPRGQEEDCFFQKHASPGFPDAFKTVEIRETSGSRAYLSIEGRAGLVAAAQMGVLELHVWGARTDRQERPDRLVFDLDPDERVGFEAVKTAARDLRERLDGLRLCSFLMATGGKGLHVVLPLPRRHGWQHHKAFAEAIAQAMAADDPDRYVATASKERRKGRIFVDWLRNVRGATAIAPYSPRARQDAPLSWPLSWRALGQLASARPATIADAARKTRRADPREGYFDIRQDLPRGGRND
jgi:bifunctional non-homologous end joining protein LigD